MSTIRGDWPQDRTLERWREGPAGAQARAAGLAGQLAALLDERSAARPQETARLLVEVSHLPAEAQKGVLAALAAGREGPGDWAEVRERIERAYPESSEKRRELGAALASLEGGEAADDPSVLEEKVKGALARLGASLSAVRPPSVDTVQPARLFGAFAGPGPQDLERPPSTAPTFRVADLVGLSSSAVPLEPAAPAVRNAVEGLPAPWRPLLERAEEVAPGLRRAVTSFARAEDAVATAHRGLVPEVEAAHGGGFWDRLRLVASEGAVGNLAARLGAMRERLGAGFEAAGTLGDRARGRTLAAAAGVLRGEGALVRQDIATAREILPDLDPTPVRSARSLLESAEGHMRAAEAGLQAFETHQDIVSSQAAAGAGNEGVAAGSAEGVSSGITQEELSHLGTGITGTPPQGFWNIGTVGAGMDPAIFNGEEYSRRSGDAVNRLVGSATSVREIGGAELAAAIRDMGVPLETVDPTQVQAALGFINAGASGAIAEFGRGAPRTVDEQRERIALALRQFRYLSEHGPAQMDRATAMNVMWSAAKIPGHAFAKMSDAEVLATAQQVATASNTTGQHEFKVGDHTVKLTIGEGNAVLSTSTKAPSFWSRVGNVAKVALTVASFIPGPVGLVARGIQAGLTLVNSVRHGGGFLDVLAAGASFVGAGAAAVGRLAGSSVAGIAGNVARVARSFSGAVRGFQGIERGGLSGVVSGAAGVAQGLSGALQGGGMAADSPLVRLTDDVGRTLNRVGAGLGAAESYIHANRAVTDAREALERARATGDAAEIQRAERQLAAAEQAKRSAVLGGLATAGQIAGDTLSRNSQGQNEPRTGEVPQGGRSPFQVGAEIFSRGMNAARAANEDDLLSAGVEALGGLAAARQGTKPLASERVIGPDGLPIVLKDGDGNPLIDEHGNRVYATTNDFNLLNEASSVADGLSDWRQAARAESQAQDAVDAAERALAQARAAGDENAIREAEARLDETRHGLVRADLDRSLALDNAASRFTGAVDTFENSRAADQYRADQERQTGRAEASRSRAKALAADLAQVIDDPRFSTADRRQAAQLREALAILDQRYESAAAGAAEDPQRLAAINEQYEQLLAGIDDRIPRLRMAALGVSDSDRSASVTEGGATAPRPPREASRGVAAVTVGRDTTIWEISELSGVPIDKILAYNEANGNPLDPKALAQGQAVFVPLDEKRKEPKTPAQVQALKDAAARPGVDFSDVVTLEPERPGEPAKYGIVVDGKVLMLDLNVTVTVDGNVDPFERLEEEVAAGNMTKGQAVAAALDGLEEPVKESMAMMAGPYLAAGATALAGPAAAGLPAAWATFATGAAGGGAGAGVTAYLRSRARGESEEEALTAAALAAAVAAPSGGLGAYAGSATGPLGPTIAGFVGGSTADLAGQGIENSLGLRDDIDPLEAFLAGLAGGAGSRMAPGSSSSELDPMDPLGLRDGLPSPSQRTTPGKGPDTIDPGNVGSLPSFEGRVPQPDKWVRTGGTISYHPDGSVTYIARDGVAVTYSPRGYPDFRPYLYSGPDGAGEVRITLTNNRLADEAAANAAAGFRETPRGYTWHHHEDLGLMQLVETPVHRPFWHDGGFSLSRKGRQ